MCEHHHQSEQTEWLQVNPRKQRQQRRRRRRRHWQHPKLHGEPPQKTMHTTRTYFSLTQKKLEDKHQGLDSWHFPDEVLAVSQPDDAQTAARLSQQEEASISKRRKPPQHHQAHRATDSFMEQSQQLIERRRTLAMLAVSRPLSVSKQISTGKPDACQPPHSVQTSGASQTKQQQDKTHCDGGGEWRRGAILQRSISLPNERNTDQQHQDNERTEWINLTSGIRALPMTSIS